MHPVACDLEYVPAPQVCTGHGAKGSRGGGLSVNLSADVRKAEEVQVHHTLHRCPPGKWRLLCTATQWGSKATCRASPASTLVRKRSAGRLAAAGQPLARHQSNASWMPARRQPGSRKVGCQLTLHSVEPMVLAYLPGAQELQLSWPASSLKVPSGLQRGPVRVNGFWCGGKVGGGLSRDARICHSWQGLQLCHTGRRAGREAGRQVSRLAGTPRQARPAHHAV